MDSPSILLNRIFFDFLLALFAAVGSSLFLKKSSTFSDRHVIFLIVKHSSLSLSLIFSAFDSSDDIKSRVMALCHFANLALSFKIFSRVFFLLANFCKEVQ